MPCVNTLIMNLPPTIKGFTRPTDDDCYVIVINARLSEEAQKEAYQHEMEHILNNHHQREDTAAIELEMASK